MLYLGPHQVKWGLSYPVDFRDNLKNGYCKAHSSIVVGSFELSFHNISRLPWFCSTLLSDWLAKRAPVSQPIINKTKTNHDLLASL